MAVSELCARLGISLSRTAFPGLDLGKIWEQVISALRDHRGPSSVVLVAEREHVEPERVLTEWIASIRTCTECAKKMRARGRIAWVCAG